MLAYIKQLLLHDYYRSRYESVVSDRSLAGLKRRLHYLVRMKPRRDLVPRKLPNDHFFNYGDCGDYHSLLKSILKDVKKGVNLVRINDAVYSPETGVLNWITPKGEYINVIQFIATLNIIIKDIHVELDKNDSIYKDYVERVLGTLCDDLAEGIDALYRNCYQ